MGFFNKKEEVLCNICNKKVGLLKSKLKDGFICGDCSLKLKTLNYDLFTANEAKGLINQTLLCTNCNKLILGKFKKMTMEFIA